MIWKLLRRNISPWQFAGYAIATLIGLSVVAVAVQLYRDLSLAFESAHSERIVISKEIGLKDSLRGTRPAFSAAELAELAALPQVADVAPLRAADFAVYAGVDLNGHSMGSQLFFESLPVRLCDADSARWRFDPARPEIPIVIPRDYLALYNFGFAASGGLPAMSEAMLSSVPLTVTISGRGDAVRLPARIVGYSDWLNTIAVPDDFMQWASARFGRNAEPEPSRVVVVSSAPGDPALDAYLGAHGYRRAGAGADLARASRTFTVVAASIGAVGAIITLLALGILVLSLYLLIQKNRSTISGLLLLGYTPAAISRRYLDIVAAVNGCVLLLTAALLLCVRHLWEAPLGAFGLAAASPLPALLCAAAVIAAVTALNALLIRRLVGKC